MSEPAPGNVATPGAELATTVAFLSDPRHYPIATSAVTVVETHMSWVFIADAHVYKLKKPVHLDGQDLTRLAAREKQCRNEMRLNRRLTSDVYLGVLPLARDDHGRLQFGPGPERVEWLVWMRRLPRSRMLDRMISGGSVDAKRLHACIAMLSRFYRGQPAQRPSMALFHRRMAARIAENTATLLQPGSGLSGREVERVAQGQREFLRHHAGDFERRIADGRIVEGHGDLRPEHVCLETPPQVIDCLEFSRPLRIVDPAEELGFLALECERLGAPRLRATILRIHAATSGDHPPDPLVHFYQSLHACVRAKLAVWHLVEPGPSGSAKWIARAGDYLRLATRHLAAAHSPIMAA